MQSRWVRGPIDAAMCPDKSITIRHLRTLGAAPLLLAQSRGLFDKHGVQVDLSSADGWSAVKNLLLCGRIDAAHVPFPVPLACWLALDGRRTALKTVMTLTAGGGGLMVEASHPGARLAKDFGGFRIGIPYRFSMANFLLSHWLAEGGINPFTDVELVEVAPSRMLPHLAEGRIDTAFVAAPHACEVDADSGAFMAVSAAEMMEHHPEDVLTVRADFAEKFPGKHRALLAAVAEAGALLRGLDRPRAMRIAEELADHYPSCPPHRLANALLSHEITLCTAPRREHAIWALTQMERWGQLRGSPDLHGIAESVCLTRDAEQALIESGAEPDELVTTSIPLMGERFNSETIRRFRDDAPFSVYDPSAEMTQHLYTNVNAVYQRLDQIIDAMAIVGAGDTSHRLKVTSMGPVGLLEHAFNEMVTNLQYSREEIEELKTTLERRVEERTRELKDLNEVLERLLHEDVLTGLHNRRHLVEALDREFKLARRHDSPLSALMIDIDHFKNVNDTHGHRIGDEVLVAVSKAMARCIRGTDVLSRYGGEEFCVILPMTPTEGAVETADRIRRAIADLRVGAPDGEVAVTVSVGIAQILPEMSTGEDLINAADDALYRAKKAGRDRIESFSPISESV